MSLPKKWGELMKKDNENGNEKPLIQKKSRRLQPTAVSTASDIAIGVLEQ